MIIFESFASSFEWTKASAVKSTGKKRQKKKQEKKNQNGSAGNVLITLLISQSNLQMALKLLVTPQCY